MRSALTAKRDVLFDELATILKNEESQLHRDEGTSAPKVFLATSTQSNSQEARNTGNQMVQNGVLQSDDTKWHYRAKWGFRTTAIDISSTFVSNF